MRFHPNHQLFGLFLVYGTAFGFELCQIQSDMFESVGKSLESAPTLSKISGKSLGVVSLDTTEGDYTIECDAAIGPENQASHTSVYAATNGRNNFVIKYDSACTDLRAPSSLIKNHEYIQMIMAIEKEHGIDITPDSFTLSRGYPLIELSAAGEEFKKLPTKGCIHNFGEGRYLVLERAGPSLRQLIESSPFGNAGPLEALHVAEKVLRHLAVLHAYQIVHGDINWENILLKKNVAGHPDLISEDLVLVDWDTATSGCAREISIYKHDSASYALGGYEDSRNSGSYRLDVLRAIDVINFMLGGRAYAHMFTPGPVGTSVVILNQFVLTFKGMPKYGSIHKLVQEFHDKAISSQGLSAAEAADLIRTMIDKYTGAISLGI
jgi:hypothetical protein